MASLQQYPATTVIQDTKQSCITYNIDSKEQWEGPRCLVEHVAAVNGKVDIHAAVDARLLIASESRW